MTATIHLDDAEPIRMRVYKRKLLEQDSDVVVPQIRVIDNEHFIQKLAKLIP